LKGSRVLLLGVGYKNDLDDYRESPAIEVHKLLRLAGVDVKYHDQFNPSFSEHGESGTSVDLTDDLLQNQDLVIITTANSDVDYTNVVAKSARILDTRNATKKVLTNKENVVLL
jgi:UDP-N-acetyl-D-glucosamine dehydrogenase